VSGSIDPAADLLEGAVTDPLAQYRLELSMAEAIGTAASIATLLGLFKLCIDAFDFIRAAQNQELDLKKLALKLSIEKCRLYTWGQAMGLTQPPRKGQKMPLDDCPFPDIVKETLNMILLLFSDSQKTREKYGCVKAEDSKQSLRLEGTEPPNVIRKLSASFCNFETRSSMRVKQVKFLQKTYWVIHDRKKFEVLIQEAKLLIDGLQDITKDLASLRWQDQMIRSRILTINDSETLDMVAEVCEIDHPAISDAASTRAETISMTTTVHRGISEWTQEIEDEDADENPDAMTIEAMESLTVTELKHKVTSLLSILQSAKRRQKPLNEPETAPRAFPAGWQPSAEIRMLNGSSGAIYDSYGDEIEQYENTLEGMASSSLDKDFIKEYSAIEKWFKVLDDDERTYASYNLGRWMNREQLQFTSLCFGHQARVMSASMPAEKNQEGGHEEPRRFSTSFNVEGPVPSRRNEMFHKPSWRDEYRQFTAL
jgi:hypothetical protein